MILLKLTIQQKIELAMKYAKVTQADMAKAFGVTPGAFWQRLKTGKFSDSDFETIAKVLDAEYHSGFSFPDGYEIKD